jgi:hypothetical protein
LLQKQLVRIDKTLYSVKREHEVIRKKHAQFNSLQRRIDSTKVFDATFFKSVEGNYLDEMLNWVEDFRKRMDDEESNQSKEELDSETKELIHAGWITEQNENERLKT